VIEFYNATSYEVAMKRKSFAKWPCSIARSADIMGDWWMVLIMREAFFGTTRFSEFQQTLTIGRNILTERLNRLVEEGVFERRAYSETPPRHDYLMTEKGRDFFAVIMAFAKWGDKWLDKGKGPPLLFRHTDCGATTQGMLVCTECGEPLDSSNVTGLPGPGLPPLMAAAFAERGR
jgi:DNA-binding HxlR family transcriptional regulator